MILLGLLLRAFVLVVLFVAGAWTTWLALYAGYALLALLAGLAVLAGGVTLVAWSPRRLTLCVSTAALFIGGVAILYFVVVPVVVIKINARAFPGHMVVEVRQDCPDGTRGILRRRIEYIVSPSGYGCSSTHRPPWHRLRLVFYDDNPNVTREPPPLAEGNFLSTGALNCSGSSRPYVHKDLAEPGGQRETWSDFVERVNFKCGVEPSNIAVQRTGARDARPGR
jgi:hypothetical protein